MTQANTSAAPEAGWLSESIPACLHRHSQTSAKAIATVDGEDSQSYEELDRESRRLARHLISSESDSKFVILFLKSGVDAALGIVGAMHSGHCSIAAATIQQLEATLTNFPTATIVLRSTSLQIPDGLSDSKRFTIDLAALPDLPSSDQELPEVSSRTTPAQVILTSGSTGEPKAVLHPQCAIQNQIRNYSRYAQITSTDRFAIIVPLHTITGQSSLFGALLNGATACFYSIENGGIDGFADWIQEQSITVLHATPTIFRRLADLANERDEIFTTLRLVRIGGEPITPSDLEAIRSITRSDCSIYLGYGCSELGTITRLVVDHETSKAIDFSVGTPVGQACGNIGVSICDANGIRLPDGESGEVVVTSDYLSLGYWNDPEATNRAYLESAEGECSYRTGDLGILRNGSLFLDGRADRQVKVRGHRVELDAVEAQLSAIPGFGTVAVEAIEILSPGNPPTLQLNAFLAPKQPKLANTRALRQAAAAEVSPVIVPARFTILSELPQTKNGKIDREALRRLAEVDDQVAATPPETELEAWLLGRWQTLLHRDEIGIHDDFFEIGGDSMTAVRIFHEITERTGKVLPVSILLEAPTVAELARRIEDNASVTSLESLIVTLRQQGSKPPLFLVHDIGGNVLNYRRLAQELDDDQPVYAIRSPALDCSPESIDSLPDSVGELAALYIQAISMVCGDRPVALSGLSFGGKVAYEIARQLNNANRDVAFLGLLDTRLEMQDCRPNAESRRATAAIRRLNYQFRRGLFHARRLATGTTENDYLQERIRKRRKKQRAATDDSAQDPHLSDPRDRLSLEQRAAAWHRKLGVKWKPQPSPVPIHYFAATEASLRGPFDNMANWRFLATQGLEVVHTQGNHISLLEDPNIATLAKEIGKRIATHSER